MSLSFFLLPLLVAYFKDACGAYVKGITFVIVAGVLNHGLDNYYYRKMPAAKQKRFVCFLASLIDRAITISTSLFFAMHSFTISTLWLLSAFCITAAALIYIFFTDRKHGHWWHVLVHLLAALAILFNMFSCELSPVCTYCGTYSDLYQFTMRKV